MLASRLQTYFNNSIWPVHGRVCLPPGRESNDILKEPAFVWKHREMFPVSLPPPHTSNGVFSLAEAGCSDGGREGGKEGRRDGWIPLNHHLYQPSPLLWEGCLRAQQNKLRVIFLWDAGWGEGDNDDFSHVIKDVLHLLVGPSGLFSSLRVTNKYLIDVRCYHTLCCTAAGLQPTCRVTVTVIKLLLRSFHKRTFRTFFRGFLSAVSQHCLVSSSFVSCSCFRVSSCQH